MQVTNPEFLNDLNDLHDNHDNLDTFVLCPTKRIRYSHKGE